MPSSWREVNEAGSGGQSATEQETLMKFHFARQKQMEEQARQRAQTKPPAADKPAWLPIPKH